MRIEIGSPTVTTSLTSGASGAVITARSRRNMLRTLVRAHQDLVAAQWQLTQSGSPADPRIERDLAAVAQRISGALSSGDESEPPARGGDAESSDSQKETS
jgi:glycogen synthase